MSKDKWIAAILAFVMVIVLLVGGFFIWRAVNNSDTEKTSKASKPKSAPSGSSLEVTDNSGLGGGIDNGAQSLGSSTEKSTDESTENQEQKQNFTEYDKYKDQKSALFGEVKAGTGTEAKANDKVGIYYKGYLTNGQVFDNQWPAKPGDKPKAFEFVLGSNGIIPGLQQGIVGMKVGGTRRIIVPPSVGYGDKGQGSIPPDSVLVFDVELLTVSKP
jgi:FKBP-type peptidyl-prolyl cis-trans isomerase